MANSGIDLYNFDELLKMDSSLVMSFLEDSQMEEGDVDVDDDEVLRAMIESLEPEIMNQDSCSESWGSDDASSSEECRFSEVDQPEYHHQDFEWIRDMENMDCSCPGHEITGYFISRDAVELGGLEDYSQVCHEMAMEEDGYIGLWQ